MIKIKIITVLFLTLFLLHAGMTYGQDEAGGLFVSGRISTEQGNVGGAVIKLFRNGQPMVDYQVDNTGRFNLRFEFNNEYVLIFQRPDNFPQKYTVSTVVPATVLQRDRKFPPYPLDVNLFTEIKGVNKSFSENTVLRIYYSAAVDNFIHETYYNNAQIKKLIDQAILQSQSVNREAELLKRLSAAELAALKRDYDAVLKKAGAEFDKGEYLPALDSYKMASRIFPAEQFPRDRIAEINDLIAVLGLEAELEKQQAEKYNQFIRQADQQFSAQQYEPSKENYTQALYIRPGDSHATGRIAEIDRIVAEMKARQQYTDIIAIADNAFREKLWDESRRRYQEALQARPGESYPASQIARIDEELQKLSQMAEKQSTFEAAVLNGDASYAKQFYPKALEFYRSALSIKPDDQAVLAKIAKVEKEQKDINDRLFYDETIANADRAFKRLEYTQARELYSTALTVRPDQTYPQRQIEAIDKIAEREREYENLIASGDAGIAAGNYTAARDDFRKALEIKSGEKYPAQKIKEIDVVLAGQAKEDQQYRQLLATADKFFNAKQFPQAKAEYQKAASQRPADNYPPEMLGKIAELEQEAARLADEQRQAEENRLVAEQQQRDNRYQALVNEADRLVEGNELVAAVSRFRDALEVKPQESYPLQRIEEIRGIITRQTEAQKTYDTAIAAADRAFREQRYPEARSSYQQAQQAKPSESYPGEQLSKIDGIEAEQARQLAEKQAADEAARLAAMAAKDREYAEAVGRADNLFREQQYPQAIAEYRKAQQVKPEESYPAQQIAEADRLNSAMQAAQKAYDTAIAAADRAFQQQRYPEARSSYQQAQQAKPTESYPGEQLSKIDGIEAEQARQLAEKQAADEAARLAAMAAKDREYAEAVGRADNLFREQQYPQAIAEYRKAQQVKPEESYPAQQIAEAGRLNTELLAAEARNREYARFITLADRAFNNQEYNPAANNYRSALQVKPDESYPQERLEQIGNIQKQRETDERYRQLLLAADGFFRASEWNQAKGEYEKASEVKPAEEYPKEQIRRIEETLEKLAQQTAPVQPVAEVPVTREESTQVAAQTPSPPRQITDESDALYQSMLTVANESFDKQQYNVSRAWYYKALEIKPAERYPSERIGEINTILGSMQLSQRDREFQQFINQGDEAFRNDQLAVARGWYNRALTINANDEYARAQIVEIQQEINSRLQGGSDQVFAEYIKEGDKALESKNYSVARVWYQRARQLKPGDQQTTEKLEVVRKALAGEGD